MDPITIGLGVAAALALSKTSGKGGSAAGNSAALPSPAEIYVNGITVWGYNGAPLALENISGAVLLGAIADRESVLGTRLDNKLLTGTGDYIKRSKSRTANLSRWKIVGDDPKDSSRVLILPNDGRGFGRGLMQIDYWVHREWFDAHAEDWYKLHVQLDKACEVLRVGWRANFDAVPPNDRLRVAVAAYNCGPSNALKGYRESRDPDKYTTGADYSKDVLRRTDKFRAMLGGNV